MSSILGYCKRLCLRANALVSPTHAAERFGFLGCFDGCFLIPRATRRTDLCATRYSSAASANNSDSSNNNSFTIFYPPFLHFSAFPPTSRCLASRNAEACEKEKKPVFTCNQLYRCLFAQTMANNYTIIPHFYLLVKCAYA